MEKIDSSYQRRPVLDMDQTSEAEIIYRRKKLEEIVEVLLNAGYHRAMSKSLSEFDKVVGGLCWCITSIGIDVDVDILFQENLIIGQRIALSEAIITALRIMGCPSPLQAHQIQGGVAGSDFPAISPVINWLLDVYHESKEENKRRYRKFSTIRYLKVFRSSAKGESVDALVPLESTSTDRIDAPEDQKDHIPNHSKLRKNMSTSLIKDMSSLPVVVVPMPSAAARAAQSKEKILKLTQTLNCIESKCEAVSVSNVLTHTQLVAAEEERSEILEYNVQLNMQLTKLSAVEESLSSQSDLESLTRLVGLKETLKLQEAQSAKQRDSDRKSLQSELIDLNNAESLELESAKRSEIADMHFKVSERHERVRSACADINRQVASNVRIIDDVPQGAEIIQYDKRLEELHQQVAWKLEETRKYYDLYNTLDTTLKLLQKEVMIFNTISENFPAAMSSAENFTEFTDQFEGILAGISATLVKHTAQLTQKSLHVEQLRSRHQSLVFDQRRYHSAVKDFHQECTKNEWLCEKLDRILISPQ